MKMVIGVSHDSHRDDAYKMWRASDVSRALHWAEAEIASLNRHGVEVRDVIENATPITAQALAKEGYKFWKSLSDVGCSVVLIEMEEEPR